jgi:thiol-disulfide isomerase/thioredoxin
MHLLNSIFIKSTLVSLLFCGGCSFSGQNIAALASEKLEVGSDAPSLSIEHWVQNGKDKFPKVTKFESGKVYVIEFWATTCGPCVQSMPHLAELQTKYMDRGLQIVSISSEPVSVVKDFLDTEIVDKAGVSKKIGDVTSVYCLTTDPDGSSEKDYMLAAEQDGIPCAFIVGKSSKIEWIGHPMELEGILEEVLVDKWDREKYVAEQKLIEEIQRVIGGLNRQKKYPQALVAIDGYIAKVTDPRLRFGLFKSKIDVLVRTGASEKELLKSYQELFASCAEEPLFVQDVAWSAYEYFVEGKIKSKSLLGMSVAAVGQALPKVEGMNKANLFDTIGRIQFAAGELESAIAAQKNAVQFSDGSDQGTFQEFLMELQVEANKVKK